MRVCRGVGRVGVRGCEATDLAAGGCVGLYQTAGRYRASALSTFLHRIVVNLAIDARRGRRPVLRLAGLEDDPTRIERERWKDQIRIR
ncbi:MAG: sigma factor [Phycisphaerae bacterium]